MRWALPVALLLLVACAPLKRGKPDIRYRQELLDDWVGATAGELVETWGPPDSTFARPDGVVVYTYERRTQYSKVRGESYVVGGKGYATGTTRARVDPAGRTLCRSFFDIAGNKVIRGSFKGPSCELYGRPFLGVEGSIVAGGLLIERVVPLSTADRFGVQAGMVLEELAGVRIQWPEDIDTALANHHAGDEVRVKLRRSSSETETGVLTLWSAP